VPRLERDRQPDRHGRQTRARFQREWRQALTTGHQEANRNSAVHWTVSVALVILIALSAVALPPPTRAYTSVDLESTNPVTQTIVNLPSVVMSPSGPAGAASMQPAFVFGIYPGGGCGEYPNVPQPDQSAVSAVMNDLSGSGPFAVHLYTAWSWHDNRYLDDLVSRFGVGSNQVTITVKYSPPAGHDGDVDGYLLFVRGIVARYGGNPAVKSFVIGNEANAYGNKEASDGPFLRSHEAVARGVVVAADEARQRGYPARIGFNFTVTSTAPDSAFVAELARLGGSPFPQSVGLVGITVYPGTWRPGEGNPSADILDALKSARATVDSAPALRGRTIEIRELGAPMLDESAQTRYLSAFVDVTLAQRQSLGISSLLWFDLWDANSQAQDPYAHYGLRRSDLSEKPAYATYRQAVRGLQAAALAR
jgi:hypothetical protein